MKKWDSAPGLSRLELVSTGPVITAGFTVPREVREFLLMSGMNVPHTRVVDVMIDTGAQYTMVRERIPRALGLGPVRYREVQGAFGRGIECPVYRMGLSINVEPLDGGEPSPVQWDGDVVAAPSGSRFDGLIGRDFLAHMRLIYDGVKATYRLVIAD